jgi:hypothetical protein
MEEDLSYKNGMLLSPNHFHEFCGPFYREVVGCCRNSGADLVGVDSDGSLMEFAPLAVSYGINGLCPFEVHGSNDCFALRKQLPELVMFGWLEKEVVNEGNEDRIEEEITSKAPLIKQGGFFPNADHSLQPLLTYKNLCTFMTLLHESCRNPEGTFPRVRAPGVSS